MYSVVIVETGINSPTEHGTGWLYEIQTGQGSLCIIKFTCKFLLNNAYWNRFILNGVFVCSFSSLLFLKLQHRIK